MIIIGSNNNMDKDKIIEVIITLLDEVEVTGEQMEHIINEVGMEGQMLRQLIMNSDNKEIFELMGEKEYVNSIK